MSSKKLLRRERQQQKEGTTKARLSPVSIFLLSIVALLVVVVMIGILTGSNREPPWAGAVWSEQHGHWH
jgi:hypothetical protein